MNDDVMHSWTYSTEMMLGAHVGHRESLQPRRRIADRVHTSVRDEGVPCLDFVAKPGPLVPVNVTPPGSDVIPPAHPTFHFDAGMTSPSPMQRTTPQREIAIPLVSQSVLGYRTPTSSKEMGRASSGITAPGPPVRHWRHCTARPRGYTHGACRSLPRALGNRRARASSHGDNANPHGDRGRRRREVEQGTRVAQRARFPIGAHV